MDQVLKNATIVTQNASREVYRGDIHIRDNRIVNLGTEIDIHGAAVEDLSGLTIIPGLIQSHVHLCQVLFRNHADDLELLDWLSQYIWPLETLHTEASLRVSAQAGIYEMLCSGVTAALDMGCADHMDIVFEEFSRSGMRAFCGKVMMDDGVQAYKESTQDAIDSTIALIKTWHDSSGRRIRYAISPRFVLSCSDELWKQVHHLSEEYGLLIHTHSSENRRELEAVQKRTGLRNVEFFVDRELAGNKLCLAHCVWLNDKEIGQLKEHAINVMHCPSANLKLGSGYAPIPTLMKAGINVSLGSDGAPCNNNLDIFLDMRLAALIHKPGFGVGSITAQNILDMVTLNGAKTLGMSEEIGSIEIGKIADLTILNLNKVHHNPVDNTVSQIVYSAQSRDVVHVMVDGKWVVRNRQPLCYQEDLIVEEANRQASIIRSLMN